MAYLDVCKFLATSNGTADFVPFSAVTGYQTPAQAGAKDATRYYYRAESTDLTQWEVGFGNYTVSGTTLARTTVLFSSTGGAKVSFTAAPQVAIVATAEQLVVPYFLAYLSAPQSISSFTETKVAYDAVEFDSQGWYDNVTTFQFTPKIAGIYRVYHRFTTTIVSGLTTVSASIYKNGSNVAFDLSNVSSITANFGSNVSKLISFNGSTDYVSAYALILGTTPSVASDNSPLYSSFEASFVAPLS